MTVSKEKFETRKLPMMPIRDVVIFPYMMTPFVVGRESSVCALEEALASDKKIFLATQHDASVDEPKANEIYQVGTVVNIVQSLKLPDGNIKVLVEGIERGKVLQIIDTEGFMQASVRLARYAVETNAQLETAMQRVPRARFVRINFRASGDPSADEVERGRVQVEAQFVYRLQTLGGFGGKSDQLNAYSVFLNDPGFFERDLARYERVTARDLHSAAAHHLRRDRRVALSVVPRGKDQLGLDGSTLAVVS